MPNSYGLTLRLVTNKADMSRRPHLKTQAEVLRMRRPALLLDALFKALDSHIAAGITTQRIAELCERFAEKNNARCPQKGYHGFPSPVCTSVNSVAAHGVPTTEALSEGDIVTVDCILNVDGWNSDAAWTYVAGRVDPDARRLVRAAWRATRDAVAACRAGNRLGRVADAAERAARSFGCSILTDFTGHGIGREIHEEPAIPFGSVFGDGEPIVPGMVVTVEPVVTLGESMVKRCSDGIGYETADGSRSAQFECTVAVFANRTEVLTLPAETLESEFPPFL